MVILDAFQNQNNNKTAEQRKKESEKLLKSLNIPYIDHLPVIEEESVVKIRTAKEIAERIFVLSYLFHVSEVPSDRDEVIIFLKKHFLWQKTSPKEREIFQKEQLTEKEIIDISWRTEAIWLLLWTIRKVDKLELPTQEIGDNEIFSRLPGYLENPKEFIENSNIRTKTEILDISDLTYRLHWATKRNRSEHLKTIKLLLSVVRERHYAINWVTFYKHKWDDITTDT